MKHKNEVYIPTMENYKEYFKRITAISPTQYRSPSSKSKKDISHSIAFNRMNPCDKSQPTLSDLDLSLLEETLNPEYNINQIKYLLEMQTDPNITLSSGDKLAKKAIIQGQTEIIKLFLQYGLDLDTPITGRASQQNAVQLARQWKRIEILELFEQHTAGQSKYECMISAHVETPQNELLGKSIDLQNLSLAEESSADCD